jgi:flagellar M-ring protein FliF
MKSSEPNWAVLYSDLSESDMAAITTSLKKSGYAYKLSIDKKAVLVPSDKQEELRMFVAENDLIKDSTPGFELLDDLALGSTDFKNRLTKQRIFQGELTRSIEKINGVTKARVQLAEPERSIFADRDEAPTASVMLILEPGYRIKASQVQAIKNLVAYAIPRLTQDRVFLTDQFGNVLSDDVSSSSNDMQSFRSSFERDAARKIKETLETIMGKDNVSVQVSADLDFNSTRSTTESFIPVGQGDSGIVVSRQGETEVYRNPQAPVVVPPKTTITTVDENTELGGTRSTTQETAEIIDKELTYEKEKVAVSYAVTKEVRQVVYAPGSVRRMTVAVAVNKLLTPQEREEIQNLVAAASGLNFERGDLVNVTSLKFTGITDEEALLKEATQDALIAHILDIVFKQIAPLLVFLILGLVALGTIRSIFKKEEKPETTVGYELDMLDPYILPEIEEPLEPEPIFDPTVEKKKNDITSFVQTDPQDAARLITSYIKD